MRLVAPKFLSIATAFMLLASNAPSALSATVKAGAACSKKGLIQNSSGKKYTCVLKGKKLVWNQGVAIKSASTPNPSPTISESAKNEVPKFEPWATKFDYNVMVDVALQKTAEYFGKITPNDKYQIFTDPTIKKEDRELVGKVLSYANGMFTNSGFNERKVFLGATHEWGATNLKANNLWIGDPKSPFPCSDGSRDAMCAQGELILLIYSDIYSGKGGYGWDYGRISVPAHEYFHTVQASLSSENSLGNSNIEPTPLTLPVWLDEGTANFYGFFTTNNMGIVSYYTARNAQITNNPNYRSNLKLTSYYKRGNDESGNYLDPYGIGQAATEYIVASVGFKPIIDIYKNYKVTKNFPSAFQQAVGISIEDFYSKFEAARSSMRITK